ncbi:MAG: ribonuclease J [Alphaproteobacteria bacterium GM202ARS2]|nr:ribonuclease J [Alphaproteobacteria bacterium GM202ARS2]
MIKKQPTQPLPRPKDDEVLFVPLGGVGEIGMNCALYGCQGQWLAVDMGVSFGDDTTPGIDIVVPDIAALEEQAEHLQGIVLTHGHEDHIGALPYLWQRLKCPLWATPLTATLIHAKLKDKGLHKEVPLNVVDIGEEWTVGCFKVRMIGVVHSIPHSCALGIDTPCGRIVHSGDWYDDPDPLRCGQEMETSLRDFAQEKKVLALMCDSTNVMEEKKQGQSSEGQLREALMALFARYKGKKHRLALTFFASNALRMESIAQAALAHGRMPVLVGRSMERYYFAALRNGCIDEIPFVSADDGARMDREDVVYLCTGSQGEPRAALSRIAQASHPTVSLDRGDVVIFSSRVIPGNEKAIGRVYNGLLAQGIDVITAEQEFVHVSGHPSKEDVQRMYGWVAPQVVVPVHGEYQHLQAQRELARSCQYQTAPFMANGAVLRLQEQGAQIVGNVHSGRLGIYGQKTIALRGGVVAARRHIAQQGMVMLTCVLDAQGFLCGDIILKTQTLFHEDDCAEHHKSLRSLLAVQLDRASDQQREDDAEIERIATSCIRRYIKKMMDMKPLIDVTVVRTNR